MRVKTAFKCHGSTRHGGLQTCNGTVVTLTCDGFTGLLPMMLNQSLPFAAATI
jgi:hypothetical protein